MSPRDPTTRREPCPLDCPCLCHDGFGGAHPNRDCRADAADDRVVANLVVANRVARELPRVAAEREDGA